MFDEYYDRTWSSRGDISEHQTEFATSLRIPILNVSLSGAHWNYITGIYVGEDILDHGVMPTEREIIQVAAQLSSYNQYYRSSFRAAMEHFAPYDIDGGANLGYYMKRPDGGWCYRKRTWRSGWWPREDKRVVLPLSHVLARNFVEWPHLRKVDTRVRS